MNQYNSGLLIPLIQKEGFKAFSLEIFVIPSDFSALHKLDYFFLFLEQFFIKQRI